MPAVFERHPDNVVFWLQALDDYSEFNKLCPEPQLDKWVDPSNPENVKYTKGPGYDERSRERLLRWTYWLTLTSLEACPENELKFDTVEMGNPDTWGNMEEELTEFGLTFGEKRFLFNLASEVNALTDDYLEAGVERFLALHRPKEEQNA
jgi:hypothetical protein